MLAFFWLFYHKFQPFCTSFLLCKSLSVFSVHAGFLQKVQILWFISEFLLVICSPALVRFRVAGHPLAQNERCLHMFLQDEIVDKNYTPSKVRQAWTEKCVCLARHGLALLGLSWPHNPKPSPGLSWTKNIKATVSLILTSPKMLRFVACFCLITYSD